jgi:hypothetical protein
MAARFQSGSALIKHSLFCRRNLLTVFRNRDPQPLLVQIARCCKPGFAQPDHNRFPARLQVDHLFFRRADMSLSIRNGYIFDRFIAQHQGVAGFSKKHVLKKEQAVNGHGCELQSNTLLADPDHHPLRGDLGIALRLLQPDQAGVSGLLGNATIDKNAAQTEIAQRMSAALGVKIKKNFLLHIDSDEMTTILALHALLLKEKTLKQGWPCMNSMQQ